MDFAGGFVSTLLSTNPRTEAASWSESSRTGHRTEPLRASAGPSLPGYSEIFPSGLTHRTQSLNLKSGRERGERETECPRMESSDRAAQDPTYAHFSSPTSPRGGRGGRKGASCSSPSSLPLISSAHIRGARENVEPRQMLNESPEREPRHARHRMSVRCANPPPVTPSIGELSLGQG